ncbi:MAG: trypsin-like serine protease [Potamolinea sp.]
MKFLSTNKKQFIFPVVVCTSYILSFAGMTQALPQPQVPSAPLSPTDPAAKLDPTLWNVPVAKPPVSNSQENSPSRTVQTVTYDLKTGVTQLGPVQPVTPGSATPLVGAPSGGLSPNAKPEASSGGVKPNSVIGTDNRQLISDTTIYPWRAMTKLYVTYPNNKTYGCSGTLIAAKYVLTAGHCVYNKDRGGYAKKIEVVPGLNGTYKPYGSAFSTKLRTYSNYTTSKDKNYDIALVTLDRTIGNSTGWLGYTYYSSINGVTGHIAGYPGDKDGAKKLYYHYGPISSSTSMRVNYSIDTYNGQSGSGVYRVVNNERYVFAVHTHGLSSGVTTNSGTRLDSKKTTDIKNWITSGQ